MISIGLLINLIVISVYNMSLILKSKTQTYPEIYRIKKTIISIAVITIILLYLYVGEINA